MSVTNLQRPISLVTGAAGFIGSCLTDCLLAAGQRVIGIDNLLLGRLSNLSLALRKSEFTFVEADLSDYEKCLHGIRKVVGKRPLDMVWHLAANSDIRAGTRDPEVDLRHTFLTTFNVVKLMRALRARKLAFASSSAIYGPHDGLLTEVTGPLQPVSSYGAMKLASEGVISSALETDLDQAWVFRFPNVVGPRATHGVIYDFLKKLRTNPAELEVLGDGRQEKPYLHVSELVDAILFIHLRATERLNCFNIGPDEPGSTVRHIAETAVRHVAPHAVIRYTGGSKGWLGDVPRFGYSIEKLRRLGWCPTLTSDQAVEKAIGELVSDGM